MEQCYRCKTDEAVTHGMCEDCACVKCRRYPADPDNPIEYEDYCCECAPNVDY